MVLYLLDANSLIDASRDYYPMERVPEFWEWLIYHANDGSVCVVREIMQELAKGNDKLASWIRPSGAGHVLLLDEEADPDLVNQVTVEGYAPDLTDVELSTLGRDPFLIAYALADSENRVVVTAERQKPKMQRANRHIPDVCDALEVQWCDKYRYAHDLDFSTGWES